MTVIDKGALDNLKDVLFDLQIQRFGRAVVANRRGIITNDELTASLDHIQELHSTALRALDRAVEAVEAFVERDSFIT